MTEIVAYILAKNYAKKLKMNVVSQARYNPSSKELELSFQNGDSAQIPLSDLTSDLVNRDEFRDLSQLVDTKQEQLTQPQLDAVNSGINDNLVNQITENKNNISNHTTQIDTNSAAILTNTNNISYLETNKLDTSQFRNKLDENEVVYLNESQTIKNKTIDLDNNNLSNITTQHFKDNIIKSNVKDDFFYSYGTSPKYFVKNTVGSVDVYVITFDNNKKPIAITKQSGKGTASADSLSYNGNFYDRDIKSDGYYILNASAQMPNLDITTEMVNLAAGRGGGSGGTGNPDKKSIVINANNQLTINGYANAQQGYMPVKDATDGLKWIQAASAEVLDEKVRQAQNAATQAGTYATQSGNYAAESLTYRDQIKGLFFQGDMTQYRQAIEQGQITDRTIAFIMQEPAING